MQFPKPNSRAADKQEKRKAKERNKREVYKLVRARDGKRCRNCKSPEDLHHHHLRFRSLGGGDSTRNLLLLCARCHADVHGYRLYIEGLDANGILQFRWANV